MPHALHLGKARDHVFLDTENPALRQRRSPSPLKRWSARPVHRAQAPGQRFSVWTTIEAAHQMDTLRAMLERRPLLEQAGVHFEATTNHETVWEIAPCL